jgi:hypothetical protein
MNHQLSTSHYVHELDHRGTDGVEVALYWNELTGRVAVAVADERTGDCFEVVVTAADNALDVFEHPYAYAALRGIDYHDELEREPVYA